MENIIKVQEFFKQFPNDNACLDHLMKTHFGEKFDCPRCKKNTKFYKIKKHLAYECPWCGYHIYPMVNTPFENSHIPLQKWFYATYLFTSSRHGVAAKELERQLGITYKTAWRMAHQIRKYMAKVDGDSSLSGHVEADETMIGGKHRGIRGRGAKGKAFVFGMVERGGNIIAKVVPDTKKRTLQGIIKSHVKEGSTISTDEFAVYDRLSEMGFKHGHVHHNIQKYVNGIHHVNTLEGFWSQIKRSIKGTHVHVSSKHLSKYLGEFEFRYNMRSIPSLMFSRLLKAF
jgi:transposase-like protein/DNA-directed RNA polymerase subunit RPC12/RpoP